MKKGIVNSVLAILLGVGSVTALSNKIFAYNYDETNINVVDKNVKIAEESLESKVVENTAIVNDEAISLEKQNEVVSIVMQNRIAMPRAIVKSGTIGTVNWTLDDAGVLTFDGGVFPDNYDWNILRNLVRASTKTVTFTAPITAGNSLSSMFYSYTNLTTINGLNNLDTSNVTTMDLMFRTCEKLISVDVSGFNTSNVTNMYQMFTSCASLTNLDVSSFDTSKVTNMMEMFQECVGLTNLDLSNFNTSNVTTMQNMFAFSTNLLNIDVSSFNTSKVTNMASMFNNTSLTSLDITHFDTSKVTNMAWMFGGCKNLPSVDLTHFDTSNVTDMSHMFRECVALEKLDLSSFNTGKVTDMSIMFYDAPIKELKLGTGFRFKSTNHFLGAPLNNTQYTGKWKLVSTNESFTQNQLTIYNGTKPGTYVWETRAFYNLSYNSQGGSAVANETVEYNQKVTQPTEPTKVGYTFGGWYKEAGCTNQWNFAVDVMPANDTTLYAKWNANPYNVTYDAQGGSTVSSEVVLYNEKVTQPTEPTRAGYTFGGWYKEAGCTNEWNFTTDVVINDVTLYAKWNLDIVVTNSAPIINAADKVLKVGDSFNPLDGVSAYDNEDGQIVLTQVNVISNNVDTSKAGRYEVTYKVTDSDAATTTKTIIVEIVDDQVVIDPTNPTPTDKITNPTPTDKITNPSVQTGDTTTVGMFIAGMLGSVGIILSSRKKRKSSLK